VVLWRVKKSGSAFVERVKLGRVSRERLAMNLFHSLLTAAPVKLELHNLLKSTGF
jgi:hypothetical protein